MDVIRDRERIAAARGMVFVPATKPRAKPESIRIFEGNLGESRDGPDGLN
jgi:hypothetical protein